MKLTQNVLKSYETKLEGIERLILTETQLKANCSKLKRLETEQAQLASESRNSIQPSFARESRF